MTRVRGHEDIPLVLDLPHSFFYLVFLLISEVPQLCLGLGEHVDVDASLLEDRVALIDKVNLHPFFLLLHP